MAAPGSASGPPTASAAPAVGGQPPWWAPFNQQLSQTRQHLSKLAADAHAARKSWKAPDLSNLGLKVDVDMFGPAFNAVKQQYQDLPEPMRQVLPYAGVTALTSLAVGTIYHGQLHTAHERYGQLRTDHDHLQAQIQQLEAQLNDVNTRRTGAHLEIQMTEAVAKAATAAAAAATAAASAAAAAAAATAANPPN